MHVAWLRSFYCKDKGSTLFFLLFFFSTFYKRGCRTVVINFVVVQPVNGFRPGYVQWQTFVSTAQKSKSVRSCREKCVATICADVDKLV